MNKNISRICLRRNKHQSPSAIWSEQRSFSRGRFSSTMWPLPVSTNTFFSPTSFPLNGYRMGKKRDQTPSTWEARTSNWTKSSSWKCRFQSHTNPLFRTWHFPILAFLNTLKAIRRRTSQTIHGLCYNHLTKKTDGLFTNDRINKSRLFQ